MLPRAAYLGGDKRLDAVFFANLLGNRALTFDEIVAAMNTPYLE